MVVFGLFDLARFRRCVYLITIAVSTAMAQQPVRSGDMFPLAKGNAWHYAYNYSFSQYVESTIIVQDSGSADLLVTDSTSSADSIFWHFSETLRYRHRATYSFTHVDANVVSESTFVLRETLIGDHPLFNLGYSAVLHFGVNLDPGMVVYRYVIPDSGEFKYYNWSLGNYTWLYNYTFIFRRWVGLDSMDYWGGGFGTSYDQSARLIDRPVVGVASSAAQLPPGRLDLEQNFPNPFNPTTVVRYEVSVPGKVRLAVYDLLGREVCVLVDDQRAPGSYDVRFDASGLASGVYFYRLASGSFVQTRRMVLVR
jgi:hypothetical protein